VRWIFALELWGRRERKKAKAKAKCGGSSPSASSGSEWQAFGGGRQAPWRERRSSCGFGFPCFAAGWVDDEGGEYAEHVENQHGCGEDTHAQRIGHGADDARHDEDDKNGIADVFQQKLRVHDAEQRQKEHEDRQIECKAQPEDDGQKEARVVVDGEDGMEPVCKAVDENVERAGEDVVVAEPRSAKEEEDGCEHERQHVSLLIGVHAGRDESPYLVQDEWRGEDSAAVERRLD